LPWEHEAVVVLGADGVAGVGVDGVEVAEGVGGVVHVLGDGSAVGGDAEEGLAVFVTSGLEQIFGNLILNMWNEFGETRYFNERDLTSLERRM